MITVKNLGPRGSDAAADSYIENGPKDPLRSTDSYFEDDAIDGDTDSNGEGASTGSGSGGATADGQNEYSSSGSSGIAPLPGSTQRSSVDNPRRQTTETSGGRIANGPNAPKPINRIEAGELRTKNPITGNRPPRRNSLGRYLDRSQFDGVGMSLWTALLCGWADPDNTRPSKNQMNLAALWMRSTGCSAENLIDFLKVEGGGYGINRELLGERLGGAMKASMTTLNENNRKTMINDLAERSGQEPNVVEARLNGETSQVRTGDVEEASQLSRMLSNYTGADEAIQIFDLHAEVTVLGAIYDKAVELGIPQAAEALMAKVEDDRVSQRLILKRVRPSAINSDLKTINRAVDLTSSARVRSETPDVAALILKFYKMPRNTSRKEYPALRDELVATLDKVHPNWHQTTRDGATVRNLTPYTQSSNDAITLLKMSDTHRSSAMIARSHPKRDVYRLTRDIYPRAALAS